MPGEMKYVENLQWTQTWGFTRLVEARPCQPRRRQLQLGDGIPPESPGVWYTANTQLAAWMILGDDETTPSHDKLLMTVFLVF